MKKAWSFALAMMLFLAVGVVATSPIPEVVERIIVENGINVEDVDAVSSVDYDNLPEQISINSIDKTDLEIYEVSANNEKLYVLTYGGEKIDDIPDKRQLLAFGINGEMNADGFLASVNGVEMATNKGYVMVRSGSITGMSTSMEVIEMEDAGRVKIVIYKNGQVINFGNELGASVTGAQKDYDSQSKEVVTFEAGDLISVYADGHGDVSWKDVITLIEITTK